MFIKYILDTLLIKLTRGTEMNMICANKHKKEYTSQLCPKRSV